jgi:hypothetical protein
MLGHLPSLDGNVSATKKTLPTASGDWYSSGHRLSVPSALRDRRQLQVIVFAMFYKAGARKLAAGFAELGCASATNGAARMLTLMVQPNRRRPITQSPDPPLEKRLADSGDLSPVRTFASSSWPRPPLVLRCFRPSRLAMAHSKHNLPLTP